MCSVCLQSPCSSRCPNADEEKPIYVCDECGYGIFEGDKFFDSPDGYICKDCLENMTTNELLELLDVELRTAEKEEF